MKRHLRAFTFIETLLGLTIFSIIALSLYSTFSSGMQLSRKSENTNKVYREIRWSLDKISQDLENARPYDFTNSYPQMSAFTGTSDILSFILATETGLKAISYTLQSPESDSIYKTIIRHHASRNASFISRYEEKYSLKLFVREESSLLDYLQPAVEKKVERDILSPNIKEGGLKFSYAYLQGEGENAKVIWKDSWKEKQIPAKVRVEIIFIKSDKSQEPLVVKKDIFIPTGFFGEEGP